MWFNNVTCRFQRGGQTEKPPIEILLLLESTWKCRGISRSGDQCRGPEIRLLKSPGHTKRKKEKKGRKIPEPHTVYPRGWSRRVAPRGYLLRSLSFSLFLSSSASSSCLSPLSSSILALFHQRVVAASFKGLMGLGSCCHSLCLSNARRIVAPPNLCLYFSNVLETFDTRALENQVSLSCGPYNFLVVFHCNLSLCLSLSLNLFRFFFFCFDSFSFFMLYGFRSTISDLSTEKGLTSLSFIPPRLPDLLSTSTAWLNVSSNSSFIFVLSLSLSLSSCLFLLLSLLLILCFSPFLFLVVVFDTLSALLQPSYTVITSW